MLQAEDGIRDDLVTGVQTCALPIYVKNVTKKPSNLQYQIWCMLRGIYRLLTGNWNFDVYIDKDVFIGKDVAIGQIGRASCRERV